MSLLRDTSLKGRGPRFVRRPAFELGDAPQQHVDRVVERGAALGQLLHGPEQLPVEADCCRDSTST
jgi:hypothetical protein